MLFRSVLGHRAQPVYVGLGLWAKQKFLEQQETSRKAQEEHDQLPTVQFLDTVPSQSLLVLDCGRNRSSKTSKQGVGCLGRTTTSSARKCSWSTSVASHCASWHMRSAQIPRCASQDQDSPVGISDTSPVVKAAITLGTTSAL